MTLAEYSFLAFAILNGARLVAYVPQMSQICRDPNGANAVSIATWSVFTAAHVATAFYAFAGANDIFVGVIFILNACGCLAIVVLTAMKRLHWRRNISQCEDHGVIRVTVPVFGRRTNPFKPIDLGRQYADPAVHPVDP